MDSASPASGGSGCSRTASRFFLRAAARSERRAAQAKISQGRGLRSPHGLRVAATGRERRGSNGSAGRRGRRRVPVSGRCRRRASPARARDVYSHPWYSCPKPGSSRSGALRGPSGRSSEAAAGTHRTPAWSKRMARDRESTLSGHRASPSHACFGNQAALPWRAPIADRPENRPETTVAIRAPELVSTCPPGGRRMTSGAPCRFADEEPHP